MNVTADPIHRLEREALARAIRHEERIRRLMRVYGYARWQAEQVETAADCIIAEMEEDELAEQRGAVDGGSGGGAWVGVVVLLALFLGAVALVRLALQL